MNGRNGSRRRCRRLEDLTGKDAGVFALAGGDSRRGGRCHGEVRLLCANGLGGGGGSLVTATGAAAVIGGGQGGGRGSSFWRARAVVIRDGIIKAHATIKLLEPPLGFPVEAVASSSMKLSTNAAYYQKFHQLLLNSVVCDFVMFLRPWLGFI